MAALFDAGLFDSAVYDSQIQGVGDLVTTSTITGAGWSESYSTTPNDVVADASSVVGVFVAAWAGTGTLPAQDSALSGVGVSGSVGTAPLVPTFNAELVAAGDSKGTGTGALETLASLAGIGVVSSVSTVAALTTTATLVAVGISRSIGIGSALSDPAFLHAASALTGTGDLVSNSTMTGAGISRSVSSVAALAAQRAITVNEGQSSSTGSGAVPAGAATLMGSGSASWAGTGELRFLAPTIPWTPDLLAGLAVWHDASKLGLADGADITAWPNLGSGNQAILLGTPTYKANAANGRGVVRFTSSSGLRGDNTSIYGAGSKLRYDYTMLYVVRRYGPTGGRCFTAPYPEGGNYLVGYHTASWDCCHDDGGWLTLGSAFPPTPPDPWRLYGVDNASNVGVRFFIAGTVKAGPGTAGNLAYRYCLNGYQWNGGGAEAGDYDVAEMPIYDRKLLEGERQQVEGYLAHKWGLTADLPEAHPYKLDPPLGPAGEGGGCTIAGFGISRTVIGGDIMPGAASIAATGDIRWVGTGALASVSTVAGSGLSRSIGSAPLQASVGYVSGFEGITVVEGMGAPQSQSVILASVAIGRSQGPATLAASGATASGAGNLKHVVVSAALAPSAAVIVTTGGKAVPPPSVGSGTLIPFPSEIISNELPIIVASKIAGVGQVFWKVTGTLPADTATLAASGKVMAVGTGTLTAATAASLSGTGISSLVMSAITLAAAPATIVGTGIGKAQGAGALTSVATLAGVGISRSTGTAALVAVPTAGGARPWTPVEIPAGMHGWWDPSIAASLTWSGPNLMEMAGQGPGGIRMVRARPSGPTLGSINGLGALAFELGQGLMTPLQTTFNDFTLFAVFKPGTSDGSTYERILDHSYSTGWWFGRTGSTQTWGGGVIEGPEVGYGIFVPLVNHEAHQISNVREGAVHRISGNGGAVVNSRAIHTEPTAPERVYMAQDNLSLSDMQGGVIGEALVWKRALPADEMAKVEGYLAHKWGIAAKLLAGHPYKVAAPTVGVGEPIGYGISASLGTGVLPAQASVGTAVGASLSHGSAVLAGASANMIASSSVRWAGVAALAARAANVTAAGEVKWAATGSLDSAAAAIVASSTSEWITTGELVATGLAAAGQGLSKSFAVSVPLQASFADVDGWQGIEIVPGAGAPQAQSSRIVSSGLSRSFGLGTVITTKTTLDGVALATALGPGALVVATRSVVTGQALSGSVSAVAIASKPNRIVSVGRSQSHGTGAVRCSESAIVASGKVIAVGTGALVSTKPTLTGTALSESAGTAHLLVVSGCKLAATGRSASIGTGALAGTAATLTASGLSASRGAGAVKPLSAIVAGTGLSASIASGVLASKPSVIAGKGQMASSGVGALAVATSFVIVGSARVIALGKAILRVDRAAATGEGLSRSYSIMAMLRAQPSSVWGEQANAKFHGALVAQRSQISGEGVVTEPPMWQPGQLPGDYPLADPGVWFHPGGTGTPLPAGGAWPGHGTVTWYDTTTPGETVKHGESSG